MNPHTHFTSLARYNVWATQRLLNAVAPLSDDEYRGDVGLFFKSIHGTLNHLLVGEHLIWFRRFSEGVSPKDSLDREAESDRQRLALALIDGAGKWEALIQAGRLSGLMSCSVTPPRVAHQPACRSPRPWPMCSTTARTTEARSRQR